MEVTLLNTHGQIITDIYPLQDMLIAVTGTNRLLLYNHDSAEPQKTMQLQHYGSVSELTEVGNGCISIRIRVTQNAPDSYHFQNSDAIELWDIATGLHIADLDASDDAPAQLLFPAPDEDATAFLLALSCCTFDDSQNVIFKNPAIQTLSAGSWESCLRSVTQSFSPAAPSSDQSDTLGTFISLYQDGPEKGDESKWFTACDTVWEKLCNGEISYTDAELNSWYWLYRNQAALSDWTDQLQTGISSFILLNIRGAAENELWSGQIDSLLELASFTDTYDAAIAKGYLSLAEQQAAALDPASLYYEAECYTVFWLRCYADFLSCREEEAFLAFDEAIEAGSFSEEMASELIILRLLYLQQANAAAEYTQNFLAKYYSMNPEQEFLNAHLSDMLQNYYVLVKRAFIDAETYNEYLRLLPADFGISINEVSPQAQQLGLQLSDLIVAVSDTYIGCTAQAQELFASDEPIRLKILRNGQLLYLDHVKGSPFGAEFIVQLRLTDL